MKQNTLSIDFRFARVSGNTYTFGYDVYRSITASTEITVQNWSNAVSIPAYYDKANQRLYAYGVSGYWSVFFNTLTFNSVTPDSERIDALTTRVGTLETDFGALTTRVGTLEGDVTALTTRVNGIVSTLNNSVVYRRLSGNPVSFNSTSTGDLNEVRLTMSPSLTGRTSVTVEHYGRNLWPFGDRTFTVQDWIVPPNFPTGTYTFSAFITTNDTDSEYCLLGIIPQNYYFHFERGKRVSATFTITSPIEYFALYAGNNYGQSAGDTATWSDIQFELGSTATDFQPHYSYSIPFTDGTNTLTVYGGNVILTPTASTLTVTHGHIASYNGETVPDGWISSTGELSTGAEIVYPLSPTGYQVYTLAPKQMPMFTGLNVVSSDANTVDLTYASNLNLG